MQVSLIVPHNLRQSYQAVLKDMAVGHRNIPNLLRGESRALRSILGINLVRRRGDLHLFANLLLVIQNQGEVVTSRVEGDRLTRKHEKTLLPGFRFVLTGRKIVDGKTSG